MKKRDKIILIALGLLCLPLLLLVLFADRSATEADEEEYVDEIDDDPPVVNENRKRVAPNLRPYFDLFQKEARKRGYDINPYEQAGETYAFVEGDTSSEARRACEIAQYNYVPCDIPELTIAARAWHTGRPADPRFLVVSEEHWYSFDELQRELLMMHELGHLIAFLEHDESQTDGICDSIMFSGTQDCQIDYNASTRTDYLDAFFEDVFMRIGSVVVV